MVRSTMALVSVAALIALAGCGGDDEEGPVPGPPSTLSEDEVMRAAQITPRDGGLTYVHDPSGCVLAVILTSAEQVELYAGAGDNVASNPDRTVGVKITDDDPEGCHEQLTEALADVG